MLQITTQRTTTPKAKPDESSLGFGVHYTDHMLIIDHDEEQGWHDARIVPYQPLELDPAAMVFHYAMESFEGLKAYRTPDGSIQLFRPDKNACVPDSYGTFCPYRHLPDSNSFLL